MYFLMANYGRIVHGRYRLEKLIGASEHGAVYQARDLLEQRLAALKLFATLPQVPLDIATCLRAFAGASKAAALQHAYLAPLQEWGADTDGTPFTVAPLLRGEDLQRVLEERRRLPVSEALRLIRALGAGLHCAHRHGVIHGTLKPHDIFLCGALIPSHESRVRVLGVGLSPIIAALRASQQRQGRLVLPCRYASPEATFDRSDWLTPAADQWSTAAILYRMLCGQPPFEDSSPAKLREKIRYQRHVALRERLPEAPRCLSDSIDVALTKDAEQRFPSLLHFLRAVYGYEAVPQPALRSTV